MPKRLENLEKITIFFLPKKFPTPFGEISLDYGVWDKFCQILSLKIILRCADDAPTKYPITSMKKLSIKNKKLKFSHQNNLFKTSKYKNII